jgi:RHS repeat-associated protein
MDAAGPKDGGTGPSSHRGLTPEIQLPKGGGTVNGMGEKFAANPVSGTGSMSVPIATSPGRAGFSPQLSIDYNSGSANGPFGFGWDLSLPAVSRKTEKGLPRYRDAAESDTFILSGSEDLVPALLRSDNDWVRDVVPRTMYGHPYMVHRYRPRVEGLFARIERWVNDTDATDAFWRSISTDNITTWYGRTAQSRIADPLDPARIFSWLICERYDDKGNAIFHEYKPEDSSGVDLTQAQERNRSELGRSAQRYVKRIYYGNRTPYFPDLTGAEPMPTPTDCCFEMVFDYGEHDLLAPIPQDTAQQWTCRLDPYSNYRACFEVRTYRLCRRVLMFHHFADEPNVGLNCLVRSTNLDHVTTPPADTTQPFYSYLLSVTQTGYVRDAAGYRASSLPPLEFEYTQAVINEAVRDLDAESLRNLPAGFGDASYRWVDLEGGGVPGILTEQGGGWYYKSNLSPANQQDIAGSDVTLPRFGPTERIAKLPSLSSLDRDGVHLMDISGDGELAVVDFEGPTPGYFERTADTDWNRFKRFPSMPALDWNSPNLRFIDLTGDGFPDLLVSEDNAFCWHPSLSVDGFAPAQQVSQSLDQEKGPQLVFSDSSESIFLADMSGDGLTDLVRIRNGEVCYWPNLGYGRFGAKVTMAGGPRFERADLFDGKRLRLADIDGSGTTDIVYFASNSVHLYFNQSGNAWGGRRALANFPAVESVSSALVLDLLGNGTACLLWSSPLPANASRPMRFVDLMGGEKPHLLVRSRNNLGAETVVTYAPSTRFYVVDKLAGTPWLTRLPFPVHVVERVETYDYISRNRFVTRYAYHHGYFDGVEREFRGFGRVDQWDTEEIGAVSQGGAFPAAGNQDPAYSVPPVHTKTWFHTGAYFGESVISRQFVKEYYDEGDHSDAIAGLDEADQQRMLLDDTLFPADVFLADSSRLPWNFSPEEMREACRAMRGSMLRQEIYALDGTDAADRPYSASERNYTIEVLQPQGCNPFAVFFVHAREAIDFHYERKLYKVLGDQLVDQNSPPPGAKEAADPRVSHALTLRVDPYGNILQSATVAYGRRYRDPSLTAADQQNQITLQGTCTDTSYTNAILAGDAYRAPLPAQASSYELLQLPLSNVPGITPLIEFATLAGAIEAAADGAHDIAFEALHPTGLQTGQTYRRLIARARILYRPDDLGDASSDANALLSLGTLQALALPGVQYQLVFTPGLVARVYQRSGSALLPVPADVLGSVAPDGGAYVDLDGDGNWWQPSSRGFYSATTATPAAEKADAQQHFYVPRRAVDSYGNTATVDFDPYDLLPVHTADAVGNTVMAAYDYRVLAQVLVTDPNGNRTAASFDALGQLVGTAVMGKITEDLGDSLTGFVADLSQADIDGFYAADDPHALAAGLLGTATKRFVYDPLRFLNTRTSSPDDPSKWLPAFAATIVRETHVSDLAPAQTTKTQIAFGYSDGFGRTVQKKLQVEPGPVTANGPQVDPRWVGSGWTVFNNKGKPVRQYEPFFSQLAAKGHQFEFGVEMGVSSIALYDPPGRVVAVLHPNQTYGKTVFDPWLQQSWDASDNILVTDPANDADVGGYLVLLPVSDFSPTWYAQRVSGGLGPQEQDAAMKAAVHANTPAISHFDAMGRPFLVIADNGADGQYATRVELDIQGFQRATTDALDRKVTADDYNMLGGSIHKASMEAGDRWSLLSSTGQPIRSWDSRGHNHRVEYDALRRTTALFVLGTDSQHSDPRTLSEVQYHRFVYGEGQPDDVKLNLRNRTYTVSDAAGIVSNVDYDFKGNPLRVQRQLVADHKVLPNWSAPPPPGDIFAGRTQYDALNRPIAATTPDGSITRTSYNAANFVESVGVNLGGAATQTLFVANVDYDAKGRRTQVDRGNGATTTYEYDPLTFRMTRLLTRRDPATFPDDCPTPQPAAWPGCQIQNLAYTYDPVGNISAIRDNAQQTIFFRNQRVEPSNDYRYDALYRLTQASGREHLGLGSDGTPLASLASSYNDAPRTGLPSPNDGNAMGTYLERYEYDAVGNLLKLTHRGSQPVNPGWTRSYTYGESSLLEPGKVNNRMSSTTLSGSQALNEAYRYDPHGNMTSMPQLQAMQWTYLDELQMTQRQAVNADDADGALHQGERTYYVYDGTGQRVRKVTESSAGIKRKERIYLDGYEVYREYNNSGAITLQRESLHVADDRQRVALVETRTQGTENAPAQLLRYQFSNHLGSAVLELDDAGQVITYEEFCPYGNTSYQAGRSTVEVSLKRYRYTRMERDEESGLSYHGARYYATWLGRWTSCDPTGPADGPNLYEYTKCCPIRLTDPGGTDSKSDPEGIWPVFSKSWKPPAGGKKSDPEGERLWARQEELRKKYAGDLPRYKLRTDNSDPVLTPMIRSVISARADALTKLMSKWDAEGKTEDANLLMHIIGDLMLDVRLGEKQWNDLSESAQSYWHSKLDHPEWAVPGNAFTGAIVDESMSLDVNFVQGTIVGYMGHSVTSTPTPSKSFSPTAPRAALPDSDVRINGEGFGIADAEGVMAHQTMNRWYSRWIRGGTRLILSRGPVNQNGIWNALTRFARSGRRATIITGVHGDEAGRILTQTPEEIGVEGDMWDTDMRAFGRRPGIRLLRADQLSDFELDDILTSGDDVYAGWCHSGVCSQLVRAFNRVNNIQ